MQKKILIVEDDEDIVSYLKDIFRNLLGIKNVEFFSVYDEKSALELLKKESIDLITLDDYLICGHGRDILKKMSDEQRNKTIVFSYDIPFQIECQKQNISVVGKSDDSFQRIKEEFEKKK